MDTRQEFIRFALAAGVLRFGEFRTKAGRLSPYFFNAGLFDDGARLGRLGEFYARTLLEAEAAGRLSFDMLFGPAYKGITLASATAVALAGMGRNLPFAFNRKEAKDHGEGGTLIGAPMKGRVVIVDDVISAGTSVRESVELIRAAGAEPSGVLIALDRQERGGDATTPSEHSATQDVARLYGIPVIAIASLADLLAFLESGGAEAQALAEYRPQVQAYRERYGV
ncbi:orotate phosphoribosyltransferase [Zeimonas arvi]|uniref:Orotate phosphoribosyltransferase n=1 Tax=Zeimonas arvi TaxID=2498847 RepID=A0A5C8NVK5_9BURK|nr:orotate phosphoribosyltransferase [Zeimonas arvi]TXL65231.1 orotate phosphoribosyltransferase [Zeimonas arvi]